MITAKDLKDSMPSKQISLDEIEIELKKRATDGYDYARIFNVYVSKNDQNLLTNLGYKVTHISNDLKIEW